MLRACVVGLATIMCTASASWCACEWHFQCGGYLEGAQMVPPVQTASEGLAILDGCATELTGRITITGPETVIGVHLHGPAPSGVNGPVLRTLPLPVAGVIDVQIAPLLPGEWDAVQGFRVFVDVHTIEHPDGALRGQVVGEIPVVPMPWSRVKRTYQ